VSRYPIKPKADRDLDDYADYLARNAGLEVSLRFLTASEETFALLDSAQDSSAGCATRT